MDRFMAEKTTESREEMSTLAIRSNFSGKLVWAGMSLIATVGVIHLIEAPEELEEATYLGPLFLANFLGALLAAIGIYREHRWGWGLGVLVAGGAFVGYVLSRTVGLPGMSVEEWLEPLGIASLLVETLFIGLCLAIFLRPAKEAKNDLS